MHAPTGACINGVGALPTPYGPTLRGAHCRSPKGSSKKKNKCEGEGTEPELNLGQNQYEPKQYLRLNLQSATKLNEEPAQYFQK